MKNQEFSSKLFIKIQNDDHHSCIQILLNTGFGFQMFRKLLHILINNFPQNNYNFDQTTITLNKDKNSVKVFIQQKEIDQLFIDILSQVNQSIEEQNKDKSKLKLLQHKTFFEFLFSSRALNDQQIIHQYKQCFADGKSPSFDDWKQIFQTFWFENKVIRFKVVYPQVVKVTQYELNRNQVVYKKLQYHTLILLPNTDIILTKTNSKQNIVLGYNNKIFYNQQQLGLGDDYGIYPNLKSIGINMHNCCYIGQLDPFSFLPSGKGCYQKLPPQPVYNIYPERFELGLPQGNFKINRIYQSQIEQMLENFIDGLINLKKEKIITFSEKASVCFRFLRGLVPGKWLLQTILDYLAWELFDFLQVVQKVDKNQNERQVFLVDTRNVQDIFSSQIGRTKDINFNFWKNSYQDYDEIQKCLEKKQMIRIIFLIIIDQSHFINVAYENVLNEKRETTNQIYLLNSLSTTFDSQILEVIKNFFSEQSALSEQNKSNFILKLIENLPQQKNGYDCSMHTLYNFIQMSKHKTITVDKIDFSVSNQEISELRLLVLQHLMQTNNWAIILSKLKKFRQIKDLKIQN